MSKIPEQDRTTFEAAIYLPMVVAILQRDVRLIEQSPFKLKQPYIRLLEETIRLVQTELSQVHLTMKRNKWKVKEVERDSLFTMYLFIYRGYEETHSYFNPRIRNRVEELLDGYLIERKLQPRNQGSLSKKEDTLRS